MKVTMTAVMVDDQAKAHRFYWPLDKLYASWLGRGRE